MAPGRADRQRRPREGDEADRRLARADRHRDLARRPCRSRRSPTSGCQRLRHLFLGLGTRPRSRVHPLDLHHRPVPGVERHLLVERRSTTSCTRSSRRAGVEGGTPGLDPGDATDLLRGGTRRSCSGTTTTCRPTGATSGPASCLRQSPTPRAGEAASSTSTRRYSYSPSSRRARVPVSVGGAGGISPIVWVGIAVGAVAVVGGVMLARRRERRRRGLGRSRLRRRGARGGEPQVRPEEGRSRRSSPSSSSWSSTSSCSGSCPRTR